MLKKQFLLFSKTSQSKLPQLLYAGTDSVTHSSYLWVNAKRHNKQKVVFQYTLEGYGYLSCGKTTWKVDKGKAFILNFDMPECQYYYPADAETPWCFVYCVFSNLQEIVAELNSIHGPVYELGENHILPRKILDLLEEGGHRKQHDFSMSKSFSLCSEIITEMCRISEKNEVITSKSKYLLASVKNIIYENRFRRFSLDEIAEQLNVSKGHICHAFRMYLNTTPKQYHENIQIEVICTLLEDHTIPIKSIAQKFNFEDVSNFCKYFKKQTTMTPGEYRNRCKNKIQTNN